MTDRSLSPSRPERAPTVSTLLEQYIERKAIRGRTAQAYREKVRRFVTFMGFDPRIGAVTPAHIAAYRDAILATCQPATWNTLRRHLSLVFTFARRERLIVGSPFEDTPEVNRDLVSPQGLSSDQLQAACEAVRHAPDWPWAEPRWYWLTVINTFLQTGMRRRQLVALRWGDLDFTNGSIRLDVVSGKQRREWRLALASPLQEQLIELRERTAARAGEPADEAAVFDASLFASRIHVKRTPEREAEHVGRFFQRLKTATGIDISAHRLRHTTGRELMRAANDPKSVQLILGHASLASTMIYSQQHVEQARLMPHRLNRGIF